VPNPCPGTDGHRELAYQLTEQFLVVGQPLGLTTVTIVGGMDMMAQAKELEKRPHIVVATPGRLCDLMRSDGAVGGKLSRVKVLVRRTSLCYVIGIDMI
jgi:ATP-dependent RNA helicase DDX49/DBP8